MLEFVDSDLYFVQDKTNFINPLFGSVEKSTGSGFGSGGPKITGSDRIRILIPGGGGVDKRNAHYIPLPTQLYYRPS